MALDINTLLVWGGVYKKVTAGETIFMEGAQAYFYHQLVSGRIRWVNIDDLGKEILQVMIEPGECFGELPLFDGEPYVATAIADEDSLIIRLRKETFSELLKENPEFHSVFSKLLTQRLRFKFYMLKEIAQHNPEHCITGLFKYLKKNKKNICTSCNQVKLTRQQIANMTGMRVETVIRAIRSLHKKGSLLIDKGKIYC